MKKHVLLYLAPVLFTFSFLTATDAFAGKTFAAVREGIVKKIAQFGTEADVVQAIDSRIAGRGINLAQIRQDVSGCLADFQTATNEPELRVQLERVLALRAENAAAQEAILDINMDELKAFRIPDFGPIPNWENLTTLLAQAAKDAGYVESYHDANEVITIARHDSDLVVYLAAGKHSKMLTRRHAKHPRDDIEGLAQFSPLYQLRVMDGWLSASTSLSPEQLKLFLPTEIKERTEGLVQDFVARLEGFDAEETIRQLQREMAPLGFSFHSANGLPFLPTNDTATLSAAVAAKKWQQAQQILDRKSTSSGFFMPAINLPDIAIDIAGVWTMRCDKLASLIDGEINQHLQSKNPGLSFEMVRTDICLYTTAFEQMEWDRFTGYIARKLENAQIHLAFEEKTRDLATLETSIAAISTYQLTKRDMGGH